MEDFEISRSIVMTRNDVQELKEYPK